MTRYALVLAAAALASPALAQSPQLTLEQQTALRCSAAFALVSHGQDNGNAEALKYPPLQERGREYLVRSMAKLMDDTGMDREAVSSLLSAEAQELADSGSFDEVMPACLLMLESAGI